LSWKWNNEEKNKDISSDQTNHIKFKRPELIETENQVADEKPVTVKIMTDGPIIIKGNFSMTYDGNRKEVQNGIISICRCGTSEHLPFCDGKHTKTGFSG
jgi:hypothetical protein